MNKVKIVQQRVFTILESKSTRYWIMVKIHRNSRYSWNDRRLTPAKTF